METDLVKATDAGSEAEGEILRVFREGFSGYETQRRVFVRFLGAWQKKHGSIMRSPESLKRAAS